MVGRTSRMSRSSRETLLNVREWSVGLLGSPGVVRSPSRMAVSPFRISGSGPEALPDVQLWSEALPDVRELSGVAPG